MGLDSDTLRAGTYTPTRDERKQRRRAQRRDGILRAARQLLLTEGIENFTVSAVASLAEVSKPAVYYYFASKEQLITALAQEALKSESLALGARVNTADTAIEAVEALVRGYCEHYACDPDSFRILYLWTRVLGIVRAVETSEACELRERVDDALSEKLAHAQAAGKVSVHASPRQIVALARATAQGLVSEATLRWGLMDGDASATQPRGAPQPEEPSRTRAVEVPPRPAAQSEVPPRPAAQSEVLPRAESRRDVASVLDSALSRSVSEACRALRAYAAVTDQPAARAMA